MNGVCVVAGVGPGTGASLARRFAAGGYRVAMLARSADTLDALAGKVPGSRGYATDVTDPQSVAGAFARIRTELGRVEVLLYNAGSGIFGTFLDSPPQAFEESWRTNTQGLVLCAKEVVPAMLDAGAGVIVVTGATASLRGGANFAVFAQAKASQRSLAQSIARSLGPRGIHVACAIIDGVVDIPKTRAFFAGKPDEFFLQPDAIAESVYHVAHQHRSAWTFEFDVRPFGEPW